MPTPVRFPGGVTNSAPFQTLANAGFLDPFFYHVYANDFNEISASDFTVTDTGTNTNALTAEDGGVLLTTTSAGASDSSYLQVPAAGFQFVPATSTVAGKKSFFKTRVKISDANTSTFYAGLVATTTTPLTANDGLFFLKASGATTFILRSTVGGVSTDLALTGFNFANATYVELGWYFDGKTTVQAYVDNLTGYYPQSGSGATNVGVSNKGAVAAFSPTLTTALLTPSFGLQNGAAASKTMSMDFILAARER